MIVQKFDPGNDFHEPGQWCEWVGSVPFLTFG